MPNAIANGMATVDETRPAMISPLRSLTAPEQTIGRAVRPGRNQSGSPRQGKRRGVNPHNERAGAASCRMQIWRAFCKANRINDRSAMMQPDLLLVWAAIFGGLTFLAMAAD